MIKSGTISWFILYSFNKFNITEHIKYIFEEHELEGEQIVYNFWTVASNTNITI